MVACAVHMLDAKREFERCWPWLRASLEKGALEHNGIIYISHEKEHLWQRIQENRCIFWPASDSAIITEFYTTPTGVKRHHTWLAGGDLQQIVENIIAIEDFGRKHGAMFQTGSGRKGWLRAFEGYRELGVRKAKPLI